MAIKLDDLVDGVAYCVVRDVSNRESIVSNGRYIKRMHKTSRDFQHFRHHEGMWPSYVSLDCGEYCFAIWVDPTRPELNDGTMPVIERIELVDAVGLDEVVTPPVTLADFIPDQETTTTALADSQITLTQGTAFCLRSTITRGAKRVAERLAA